MKKEQPQVIMMGKKTTNMVWEMSEGKKTIDELRLNYEMAHIKPM